MKTTVKKSNSYARGGRAKPATSKLGFTKGRSRRYSCGGKIKK